MYRRLTTLGTLVASFMLLGFSAQPQTYKLDSVHSFIAFEIGHLGVAHAWGLAPNPAGTVTIDEADASKSSIAIEVKADGIITGTAGRDTHLKSPDFFDAKQFPTISFKSSSMKKTADKTYEVTGDFTLHGVTKPLTITLNTSGEKNTGAQFGTRQGFETSFSIKRSDFGMTKMTDIAQDEVKLFVSVEGTR